MTDFSHISFSRETLAAAYSWLQQQPDSIKKLATTPEALASLYLRASKYAQKALGPDQTAQFTQELKSLATDLKNFETPPVIGPTPAQTYLQKSAMPHSLQIHEPQQALQTQPEITQQPIQRKPFVPPTNPSLQTPPSGISQPIMAATKPPSIAPVMQPLPAHTSAASIDMNLLSPSSQQFLRDIRRSLNLSSDAEAINVAAGLAHQALKSLF